MGRPARSSSSSSCWSRATSLAIARPPDRDPVPDPARPRRPGARVRARPAAGRARAGPRVPPLPAADPVRGRLLHLDPRLQGEPARRSGCSGGRLVLRDDRRRRRRRPRPDPGPRLGGRRSRSARSSPRPMPSPRPRSSSASGVPRRIVTILEGESLVNDATALVAYRFAVAGGDGRNVLARRGERRRSSWSRSAGSCSGCSSAWSRAAVLAADRRPGVRGRPHVPCPGRGLPAGRAVRVSGVLAAVAAGIYVGRHAPRRMSSRSGSRASRLAGPAVPDQRRGVHPHRRPAAGGARRASTGARPASSSAWRVAISLTAILVRIVWVFPGDVRAARLSAEIRAARGAIRAAGNVFLVSWAGMRGVVSLAAAAGAADARSRSATC